MFYGTMKNSSIIFEPITLPSIVYIQLIILNALQLYLNIFDIFSGTYELYSTCFISEYVIVTNTHNIPIYGLHDINDVNIDNIKPNTK